MITVLHGTDTERSRRELVRIKNESTGKELRVIDGRACDATMLTQALEASSLFAESVVVVIERLFGRIGKKTKEKDEFVRILASASPETSVIVWEDRKLEKMLLSALGSSVTELEFTVPVVIWQFLDSIRPNNTRALVALYRRAIQADAPELVGTLLMRRFRQLIIVSDGVTPEGMTHWQAARLTNQAKFFTIEKLRDMYQKLISLEYAAKSGATPFPFGVLIEKFLIEL